MLENTDGCWDDSDDDILEALTQLGAPHTLVVSLDMPKNLSISGRFRQEEI
jgi:hypothetical protein